MSLSFINQIIYTMIQRWKYGFRNIVEHGGSRSCIFETTKSCIFEKKLNDLDLEWK
jgi:hypothetical protein